MIYTLNRGVDKRLKDRIFRGASIGLPLLALVFLAIAIFSASTSHSAGQDPYIKTKPSLNSAFNDQKSAANNKGHGSGPTGTAANNSVATAATPPAMSMNTLSSAPTTPTPTASLASTPSTTTTGGMGGGDITSSAPSSGTSSPTATVVCTNLLSLSQVCTACTPPLTLQPGQKALLSADGTCVAVN